MGPLEYWSGHWIILNIRKMYAYMLSYMPTIKRNYTTTIRLREKESGKKREIMGKDRKD